MRIILLFTAIILGVFLNSYSQETLVKLQDRDYKPICYAAVKWEGNVLYTDSLGRVSLPHLTEGEHVLRLSALGFEPDTLRIVVPHDKEIVHVLKTQALSEVVVYGVSKTFKTNSKRTFVDVQHSSLKDLGTLCDVLSEIPKVQLLDGKISVVGKGTPAIFVDGRRVDDLSLIGSIKSTEVKSVELQLNPSNKYGVNVSSAIVINTRTKIEDTFGVDLYQQLGYNSLLNSNTNLSFHLAKKKYVVKFGAIEDWRNALVHNEELYSYQWQNLSISNLQQMEQKRVNSNLRLNLDALYYIGSNHSLSAFLSYSPYRYLRETSDGAIAHSEAHSVSGSRIFEQASQLQREIKTNTHSLLWGSTYALKKEKTSFDFTFSGYNDYSTSNQTFALTGTSPLVPDFQSNPKSSLYALKGDFEQEVSNASLQIGGEYSYTNRNSTYQGSGIQQDELSQNLLSAYVGGTYNIGEHWNVQGRLGYEGLSHKHSVKDLAGTIETSSLSTFLPALNIACEYGDFSATLAYAHTSGKPSYEDLSSQSYSTTNYLQWRGNPKLLYSIEKEFSLDAAYKWVSASLSFSTIHNGFFYTNELSRNSYRQIIISPQNLPLYHQWGCGISVIPKLGHLQFVGVANVQFQDLKYNGLDYNKPLVEYNTRLSYSLPNKWLFSLGVLGHLPNGHFATGLTKGYANLELRVLKKWLDGRLVTQLYAKDILNTAYENVWLDVNRIQRQDYSSGTIRGIYFSIQYHWGIQKKQTDRSISSEIKRLSLNNNQ